MNLVRNPSLALLGAVSLSFGQWDVNQLYASSVKQTGPRGTVRLNLDSLDLEVSVSAGLVRTRATMTWTPDSLVTRSQRWVSGCSEEQAIAKDTSCAQGFFTYDVSDGIVVDSLEGRSSLQLPLDAAVTGLWFWMDGQKVASYVMDRWKASQQYNQIVGARRDPALLETWGSGSYNLNMFPMKSGESRKLQIEIVQPLRDGLQLPVVARGIAYHYDYSAWQYVLDSLRPSSVRLTVHSDAPTSTVLDLAGLGRIAVGTDPIVKSWSSPDSLVATVVGRQPEIWTAVRDGKGAFGAGMVFKGSELNFQPEPTNRLVVLDATDSLERARKLALLSLLKYGKAPYRVNLAWRDGKTLRHLWPDFVTIDESNGLEALRFLKTWKPSSEADAKSILHEVVKSDTGAVVVLISTSPYETFSLPYPNYPSDWGDSAQVRAYRAYIDSSDRFWKRIGDSWDEVGREMLGAGQTLFGWWSDWYASNASGLTGGYSFGSVLNPWYRWWVGNDSISAPALYGPSRYGYREFPANLKVEIEGIQIDSLASLFQRTWGYLDWGGPFFGTKGLMIADRKLSFSARSASSTGVVGIYDDSLPMVFSARYAHGGPAKVNVSGTWGGLKFKGTRSVQVPEPSGTEWGTRVWAGEYANMAQPWIWTDSVTEAAVRALGKGYQIVTPATSFLALEPGTKPLDSLAAVAQGTTDKAATGTKVSNNQLARDSSTTEEQDASGSLDATSLDELFLGRIVSVKKIASEQKAVGLRILAGSVVTLDVLGHDQGTANLRILDLKGREVARLGMNRSGDHWTVSWKPTGRGVFFAVAEGPLWKHSSTFTVGR